MAKHNRNQPELFVETEHGPVVTSDPCERKHGGAATSRDAHEKIAPHKRETYNTILRHARNAGVAGVTVHELCGVMDTTPNAISGRLTELKQLGELAHKYDGPAKVRRGGAYVLVVTVRAKELIDTQAYERVTNDNC